MDKIIYSGDQDPLLEALDGQVATFYESGRQVKSAASSSFSHEMMKQYMPDDKHFAVHYIALGAGEHFGPNKNGDHWPEKGLAHDSGNFGTHTFVKNGHYFREHRNRDPKQKIGDIKAAAYNHDMKRSEVIVWGDKEKAAKEYEKAKAGKGLTCSMSGRVPGDTCSCCSNFAKRSSLYCDCLKNHMLQWRPKFAKFAYAINDEPNFFDLSDVENRADRIALQLEVMMPKGEGSTKSASIHGFTFSDQLAKEAGVYLPDSLTGCCEPANQRWLDRLCEAETYVEAVRTKSASVATDARKQFVIHTLPYTFSKQATADQLTALRQVESDVLFAHLAKRASVLPFNLFYAYATNSTLKQVEESAGYKYASTNLMSRLFRDVSTGQASPDLEQLFAPASSIKSASFPVDSEASPFLQQLVNQTSIDPLSVRSRAVDNCFTAREVLTSKSAGVVTQADIDQAKVIAKAYAFYKIAFVTAAAELNGQDSVDDAAVLLVSSQHNT
jgi:hypothetical protein